MIDHCLLTPWFFRRTTFSVPPVAMAPTEDNPETQAQAEAAAQKERENIKKRRRPTLLTGVSGVQGEPALSSATLAGGKIKLGQ
jgi:hypothetical protein